MPELPEVEAVCRKLQRDACGSLILRTRMLRKRDRRLEARTRGRRITQISRRAKNVLIHLDNDWVVRTNPYEGGSDHVPFLRAGLPGLLLWHFTDVFYHTDGDRIDKVSAETLKNVGVCAAVSAMTLTASGPDIAQFLVGEVERAALDRIDAERRLSVAAVESGVDAAEEQVILEAWTSWYEDALETMTDIEVGGSSESTMARITAARAAVAEAGRQAAEAVREQG